MRKLIILLIFVLLPLCAQNNRISRLKNRHALPAAGLVALYRLGAMDAGVQTTGARWTERKRNLAAWSEDLTKAAWAATNVTKDSATTLTFTAQNGTLEQTVSSLDGVIYTFSAKIRRISGNYSGLRMYVGSSASSPAYASLTITDVLTLYSFSALGRSGGGSIYPGIQDTNASGWGQIEFTEFQVTPGTLPGTYEKTEANQRLWDYSGNANHATRGSTSDADTNDPSFEVEGGQIVGMGFNGSNNYCIRATTPVVAQPATVLIVHKMTSFTAQRQIIDGDDATDRVILYNTITAGLASLWAGTALTGTASTAGSYEALIGRFNGATSSILRNGTQIGSGDVGTRGLSGFILGTESSKASNYVLGTISTLALYSRALSGAEIERIQRLLKRVQPELALP